MKKAILLGMVMLLATQPAFTQNSQYEFIRSQYFRPGFHIKSWTFDGTQALDRFTEFAVPISFSTQLSPRLAIDVVTSPFLGVKELPNGLVDEYHNLSDTFLRSSLILGDNAALLTFGVGIPTGETNLDADEFTISGIASNRSLDNPVSNFGTGLSLNFGLALAHELGDWVVGVGAGYSLRQQYDATFSGQAFEIEPGDELNLTVGLEREFVMADKTGKFLADLIFTNYSEDKIDGESVFEAGNKVLLRGQLIVPAGFLDPVILSVTQRWRSDNRSPNPDLLSNGNELELRATAIHPMGGSFKLKYVGRAQLYGDNANDAEGATIYGIGGGFILNISRHFSFDPTFIYSKGTINTGPDSEIDVTGLELTGGFAFTF